MLLSVMEHVEDEAAEFLNSIHEPSEPMDVPQEQYGGSETWVDDPAYLKDLWLSGCSQSGNSEVPRDTDGLSDLIDIGSDDAQTVTTDTPLPSGIQVESTALDSTYSQPSIKCYLMPVGT